MSCEISVIIPVYNCESYLERAINSIVSQNIFDSMELILVDDGSTDGSGKICDKYSDEHENVIVIHQENSGVSVSRNNGIEKAQGEWIAFLDSDDYFLENAFEKMLENKADMICFDHTSGWDESNIHFNKSYYTKDEFDDELYPVMATDFVFYNCWNKLYKKRIISDNNLQFIPGKKYGEDMMFVYEYIKYINNFSFIDKPLYYYYQNENSVTKKMRNSFNTCKANYLWLFDYFSEIDCDTEKYREKIARNFVFRTAISMWDIGFSYNVIDGSDVIKKILNDSVFRTLNAAYPLEEFEHKYYEKMYRLIQNDDYLGIMLFVKSYYLKTEIYKKIQSIKKSKS